MRHEGAVEKRVAVVGAGVGGLAAARLILRRPGVSVAIYERAGRAGGVLHTSRVDGFVREHAANGFLPSGDEYTAMDLARELGVEMIEAGPAARKRWIYRHGRLHALPTSPVSFATTRLLSLRGKLALLAEPLRGRGAGADESIHAFASRRLGREFADALVVPMVTGIFGGDARTISVQAGFPILGTLEDKGGLVVGGVRTMIGRARAARARGAEPGTDRKRRRPRLGAPRLGVGALVDALVAEVGGALVLDREVTRVAPGPELHFADGSSERFDAVVLATPAYVSARLCEAAHPALAEVLEEIPYAPIAVVHLGVDRSHIDHPLDGFGFLVAEGEDVRVLGTVFESVIYEDRAPAGHALLRCIYGGARDPAAVELPDAELVAQARADLDRALGGFAQVRLSHENVVKWPRAIAQYTLGHADRVARAEELAADGGVVLAGSAYHGVAVNKIVADAARVCDAVMDRLGAGGSRETGRGEPAR